MEPRLVCSNCNTDFYQLEEGEAYTGMNLNNWGYCPICGNNFVPAKHAPFTKPTDDPIPGTKTYRSGPNKQLYDDMGAYEDDL